MDIPLRVHALSVHAHRRGGADRQHTMTLSTEEFIHRFLLHVSVITAATPPSPVVLCPMDGFREVPCVSLRLVGTIIAAT
jgi:hypothetical protein